MSGIARLIVFEPNSQFTRLRVLWRSIRMMDCEQCSSQDSYSVLVHDISEDDNASEFWPVVETSTPAVEILKMPFLEKAEGMPFTSEIDTEENLEPQAQEDLKVNLQNLIRERKVERKFKAEEKRRLDLQRIRDMTSKTGIEPQEQFPKEIWTEIFKWVEPEDRWSTWHVHPLFSQLMETSAMGQVLLPKVFKVDAFQHCFVNRADWRWGSPVEFNKGLRYISRLSRDSFDRWMDASFEKEMRLDWHIGWCERPRNNIVTFLFFKSSDHILLHRLLTAFGEGSNPAKRLFSRGFRVDYTEYYDESDISFLDNIEELEQRRTFHINIAAALDIIGDQIWNFQFKTDYEFEDVRSFTSIYSQLLGFISKLGNLKIFQFSVSGPDISSENLCFLKAHPFPHIASLERITLERNMDPNSCQREILGAVLVANPQIKILDLTGPEELMEFLPVDEIKGLAHLSSFTVGLDEYYGQVHLRTIRPLVNFRWPLKSINLVIDIRETEMSSLFRFLEKFTSLEDVKLAMYLSSIRNCDAWGYLELPNLNNLYLDVVVKDPEMIDYDSNIHFFFSLQFLIHCGNLAMLSWIFDEHNETKLRQNLKAHEVPEKR